MVKLALWMPLLSLAASAVTSPVQSYPDGRDLRSPDGDAESLSEKKERVKSAISEGIMFVSDLTSKAIDSFPQEITDLLYTTLDDLNVAVNQDDIDNSDHANETADSGIGDLESPDSRTESSPDKKAIIKSTASLYFGVVHNQINWEIDQLSEKPFNFFYGLLSALDFSRLKDFPQGLPLFINGIKEYVVEFFGIEKTPTERDSTQAPPSETFNSATELIKHMIASNFGIDLTQAFNEAIPEGVMEKSFADSNDNNDTREAPLLGICPRVGPYGAEVRRQHQHQLHSNQLLHLASKHRCALKIRKNSLVHKIKLQWFVDLPPNSPDPFAERLTCPPSPNQNKDASHTYVHMHRARDADLFEDFCKDRLPDDEVYVPPQHQPINPEDEDDVVPDQHAAFGITKATQRQKEAAWKDLGLSGLMNRGPPIVKGKGAAGGSRMPR
ncbi:protein kinase [Colletotrichum asianum]|uniref:Protein kinase n=1 Tax=Colletotrichum asianum TaxID=702518 RepID=A0A8H3WML0_9PEZI|nr:protein kinase [Colletotrichum asianum]